MNHYNTPAEISTMMLTTSEKKANLALRDMIVLGILAGAYVALAGNLSTVVVTGVSQHLGTGLSKFLGGSVFALGLILVVIGGGELFTGNALMVMGLLSKRISTRQLVRNWAVVYLANFVGSLIVAALVYLSGIWQGEGGQVGARFVMNAHAKVSLPFVAALVRGILANWLVCLGVWLGMAARDIVGKILAIYFPVMAFVACGFEHSIANHFAIPIGIALKNEPMLQEALHWTQVLQLTQLTWSRLVISNLIPVTLGNIIGGAFFVGTMYWLAYQAPDKDAR
ncbi:MAG: formate/nitrite transporter family protein [Limnochordia bacterium]